MPYFRQLFDVASATYSYLLADSDSGAAVLIDPVLEHVPLYQSLVEEVDLHLDLVLETHRHADHASAARSLHELTGARVAVAGVRKAEQQAEIWLADGHILRFGKESITVIATPGHTAGCLSFLWRDRIFTGDALLIGDCGRTDTGDGDPGMLYDSITRKIWPMSDEVLVYPGHDYRHRRVSCVMQERQTNRCFAELTRDEFIALMARSSSQVMSGVQGVMTLKHESGTNEVDYAG